MTRERYRGALLGLAAGDALGTTLEFKPPGTFAPLADMIGGGPFHLKPANGPTPLPWRFVSLRKIVRSYRETGGKRPKPGILIAIYVALTRADASAELVQQCKIIAEEAHIPVMPTAKDDLMRMTLRALLKR